MVNRLRVIAGREEGTSLIETALVLPLMLFICVSIFEFGRAFQTWQVLTNAAREGARIAVLPGKTDEDVTNRVQLYMSAGALDNAANAVIKIARDTPVAIGSGTASGSQVTVEYPFSFMVLQPVAELVVPSSTVGNAFTMAAATTMRNE